MIVLSMPPAVGNPTGPQAREAGYPRRALGGVGNVFPTCAAFSLEYWTHLDREVHHPHNSRSCKQSQKESPAELVALKGLIFSMNRIKGSFHGRRKSSPRCASLQLR